MGVQKDCGMPEVVTGPSLYQGKVEENVAAWAEADGARGHLPTAQSGTLQHPPELLTDASHE
jgi:hypothetical protein